jgi:hypothetical protein
MGFYYHTWETTKQNVTLCSTRLYFLLHINMTRIQTWKKKCFLLTNKTFKILSKVLLSLFCCIYWIKSTTFISSYAYYNYFKLNMMLFKHCIKQNLPEPQFSMPMIYSTIYEKYNATTVLFLCSLLEQNLLCIQQVTEKVGGIFTTIDSQLCQNLHKVLNTMQKSAL